MLFISHIAALGWGNLSSNRLPTSKINWTHTASIFVSERGEYYTVFRLVKNIWYGLLLRLRRILIGRKYIVQSIATTVHFYRLLIQEFFFSQTIPTFFFCNCIYLGAEGIKKLGIFNFIFSSPEHEVLKVSFCDRPSSVVHRPSVRPCVRPSTFHTNDFSS